jgi:hypothetical protein
VDKKYGIVRPSAPTAAREKERGVLNHKYLSPERRQLYILTLCKESDKGAEKRCRLVEGRINS